MYEQYYYAVLHELSLIPDYLLRAWYWWRFIIYSYPEQSIAVVLMGILFLFIMHIKRGITVVTIKGDEISRLIKAIKGGNK